jgi:hypothetical protein
LPPQTLRNYDRILLISDGVTKAFHIVEAAAIVQEHEDDLKQAVEKTSPGAPGQKAHMMIPPSYWWNMIRMLNRRRMQ